MQTPKLNTEVFIRDGWGKERLKMRKNKKLEGSAALLNDV